MSELPRQPALPVVVKLTAQHRSKLIDHFMTLVPEDRLLRFGNAVSDDFVRNYVLAIDFDIDVIFGVVDDRLQLLGVAHLAFLRPVDRERRAELGISVLARARKKGIGSALFDRAAIRCRNGQRTTLYMHCLLHNDTMMRIAQRAGMAIRFACGEADAYLALPPATPTSQSAERRQDRRAAIDYESKRRLAA